jgi:hypothetical protein
MAMGRSVLSGGHETLKLLEPTVDIVESCEFDGQMLEAPPRASGSAIPVCEMSSLSTRSRVLVGQSAGLRTGGRGAKDFAVAPT